MFKIVLKKIAGINFWKHEYSYYVVNMLYDETNMYLGD